MHGGFQKRNGVPVATGDTDGCRRWVWAIAGDESCCFVNDFSSQVSITPSALPAIRNVPENAIYHKRQKQSISVTISWHTTKFL